jgi:hypothetical protein
MSTSRETPCIEMSSQGAASSKDAGVNLGLYPVKGQPSAMNILAEPSLAKCFGSRYGTL